MAVIATVIAIQQMPYDQVCSIFLFFRLSRGPIQHYCACFGQERIKNQCIYVKLLSRSDRLAAPCAFFGLLGQIGARTRTFQSIVK